MDGVFSFFNLAGGGETNNHHIEIKNNHIHHTPNAGIRMQDADYVVIEDNILHDCSWWSSDANGGLVIAAKKQIDTKKIVKIIVRRNMIYHCGNYNVFYIEGNHKNEYGGAQYDRIDDGSGISFTGFIGAGYQMDGYDLIENNICFDNGMNGLTFQQTKNGIIRNNTVYDNNKYPGDRIYGGIAINAGENIKVYNNIAVGSVAKPNLILYNILGTPNPFVADNNIKYRGTANAMYGDAVIDADPMFVYESSDPTLANFSLKEGSTAIDLGTTQSDKAIDDFDGHKRPIGVAIDAGALEFSSDNSFENAENNKNFWDEEDEVITSTFDFEEEDKAFVFMTKEGNIELIRFEEEAWKLYNLNGQLIKEGLEENVIDTSELAKGMYLLKVGAQELRIVVP